MTTQPMHRLDEPATTTRSRILLVEDDELMREALQILLGEGFDVDAAASAEAALEGFVAGRYDVLVTDLGLPGRKGHELRRALQEVDPGLSAVLITADDLSPGDPRLAGFEAWWHKPCADLDTLLQTVQDVATLSRRRRAG